MPSSIDESKTALTLFNKEWNIFRSNWQNTGGGLKNKFATIFNSNDVNCLKEYNRQLQAGIKPSIAYKNTMNGCTKEAKKNAVAIAKGSMTYEQATSSMNQMTLGARAATFGMKALSLACNMLVTMAISWAISKAVEALDNYIHRVEKAKEKTEEAIETYENVSSEVDSLKDKIAELNNQIDGLNPITDSIDIENLEKEKGLLEAELALLKEKEKLESLNKAKKPHESVTFCFNHHHTWDICPRGTSES